MFPDAHRQYARRVVVSNPRLRASSHEDGPVEPGGLERRIDERLVDSVEDRPVSSGGECDEYQTRVASSCFRPAPGDRSEVPDVVCDQDPCLLDGEFEQFVVREPAEKLILVDSQNVVAGGR